ncbi:eukaryotic translation initiation factor 2 subunit gamma [Coemansia sp. RSA 1646]|nr:eukaryotic translation initiation factor 2 subunit gamma [Coemansia sp. RSA 1646]
MTKIAAVVDPTTLSPTSIEVMANQATINIGTIGHVSHGKSTLVRTISGVQTFRYERERKLNITIKLGYANAKIYKCDNEECPRPGCYESKGSAEPVEYPCKRPGCGGKMKLVRHISFVDCPGHDVYMMTMLSGAAVMDAAMLLVAANEPCPQPQTSEHLVAIEMIKLKNAFILQNKVDRIKEDEALINYEQIKKFSKNTIVENAPIIPISAQLKVNIDAVIEYVYKHIPIPVRDFTADPHLIVIRSFDINKPGFEADELRGGVVGGSILKGVLKVGDEIELRPGRLVQDPVTNRTKLVTLRSRIVSLNAEANSMQFAVPGGLIGVGSLLDPALTRQDLLAGNVLGHPGKLPKVYTELEINYFLLRQLLGMQKDKRKSSNIGPLKKNEILKIAIGSLTLGALVIKVRKDIARLALQKPACADIGEKIAISRNYGVLWRLIGWASIVKGKTYNVDK